MLSHREHVIAGAMPQACSISANELAAQYNTLGRQVILYTGTFEAYQGLDLLVEAAPIVLDVKPATTFLCLGGKETQIAALQRQAVHDGVAHCFIFPGPVSPEEVERHFALADVLVSLR